MKLSRKFLSEYVDIDGISTKEIADKMTLAGNEYEEIKALAGGTNLTIGYVKECIPHPDSDHLHVCQVEIKPNEVTQIVCGAPNVAVGQKVIVSLPGAILPGGFEIKSSTIRGVESNGMICSLSEIGIDNKYQSEEDREGIHVLDNDAKVGEEPLAYLELNDEIIDFDLTSNRGDLLSIIGMAYEVGAIFNKEVNINSEKINNETDNIESYLSLDVITDNCPLYLARMVRDVVIKESPSFIKNRLIASGIRPINNVVDISNYVMLEYGNPLHFFDYETLGNKIIVRMAEDNEKMTTLDKTERTLSSSDIVIASEKEAVCLAGVMGGLNSEVELTTKDIIIESAIFDSVSIRKTSNNILRSEASNRFEKGLDAKRTYGAIDRACYLLEKYADGKVIYGMKIHDKTDSRDKVIEVSISKINNILGMNLDKQEIISIFKRLGFSLVEENNDFKVTVPSRKLDINIKEDLIEEIGRIHGLDKINGTLPKIEIKPGKYDSNYLKEKLLHKHMQGLGLRQVITYSLVNDKEINLFNNKDQKPFTMLTPISKDRKHMRQSLLPSLLNIVNYNLSRKNNDISIYEISKVYHEKDEEVYINTLLSGAINGSYLNNKWQHQDINVDFYLTKGIVEEILKYLGLSSRYTFDTEDIPKEYHPYQTARILVDNKQVGYLGCVNPSINKNKIYLFELNLDIINTCKVRKIKNKEINKYPSIVKDLAFIVKKEVKASDIIKTVKKACGRLLTEIDVFDYYVGDKIGNDSKSLAFKLTFSDFSRTLNDEEVLKLFNNTISSVEKNHNGILRDK